MKYINLEHFISDAFIKVKERMVEEDLEKFKELPDVLEVHHTLGRAVRNFFGLWNVNNHLGHADVVSHKFLQAFQDSLKSSSVKEGTTQA